MNESLTGLEWHEGAELFLHTI